MRIICFLLFVLASGVFATPGISQVAKVSISMENATVANVIDAIENQTDYLFVYSKNEIDLTRKVSVDIEQQSVAEVLTEIFDKTNIVYAMEGSNIMLMRRSNVQQPMKEITGKVIDFSGVTLPGVSVVVKGTTTGTITDADGKYSIEIPLQNTILQFSFIGYISQSVAVSGRNILDISMALDIKALDEVVVIGYGTQKRENVIGSIGVLDGQKLQSRPVTRLQDALTGQMPGVTVTQRNGRPGSSSGAISIRGVGSFGADPSVLILVDGIPVDGFNDVDPNDVENISVLKDASSASIYGARAANGVILVTTKNGSKGKVKITYNGYIGVQVPTATPEFVNSFEYAIAFNEGSPSPFYTDAAIQAYKDGSDPDNYPNTNFLGSVLKKQATQTGHNVNVSGGTDNNQYNFSFGYLYQDGLIDKNDYQKYNTRLNMTTSISPKIKLTTRVSAISSNVNEPGTGVFSIIDEAVKLPGVMIGIYSNGDFGDGYNLMGTPFSSIASKSFYKTNDLKLNGNMRLDYEIIKGLKLSGITSYVRTNGEGQTFVATQKLKSKTTGPNMLTETTNSIRYYTFQGLADYSKQFKKHQINALAGYSFEKTTGKNLVLSRNNFPSNDKPIMTLGSPSSQQSDGTAYIWAIESQFARVNYSYAGKYLLEGVIRRDGSSRFPETNKYAYFPSIAIGWRIGQETFIQEKFSWISELKLKASRGVLGNQNISNYPYQNTMGTNVNAANTQSSVYSLGGIVVQGVARTQIVDPTLHWESTRTTDAGLEFGLFKNVLTGSVAYFNRYTYGILVKPSASVSSVLGFDISQQNAGSLENKGWEFTLNFNKNIGEVVFNIRTNFSIINNKALDLGVGNIHQPNGLIGNGSTLFIGYPIQLYYGYEADGLFVDQADIDSWPKYNANITPKSKPGDIRYKDLSGPDGVPDGVVDATYDQKFLGSQIPKYTYGISFGGNYKGFDVNFLLQGITGVQGNLSGNFGFALNTGANIQRWQYEGRWTAANPDRNAIYPRIEVLNNAGNANTPLSSFWILDGSYLRLKNAQIGYTLPKTLLQKSKISSVRFYLSGENIFTKDNYRKGWDPEINTGSTFYPIISNYTFGVNVIF